MALANFYYISIMGYDYLIERNWNKQKKSQGIKTKLVEWIKDSVSNIKYDRWIELRAAVGSLAL
jgi:hypothetical protein